MIKWEVSKFSDLIKVREHFELYNLQTSQIIQFRDWCEFLDLVLQNKHITKEGLLRIVALKGRFAKGVHEDLHKAFPYVKPLNIEDVVFTPNTEPLNGHWISGLATRQVCSDGCFTLGFGPARDRLVGYKVQPAFIVTQHNRDAIASRSGCCCIGKN